MFRSNTPQLSLVVLGLFASACSVEETGDLTQSGAMDLPQWSLSETPLYSVTESAAEPSFALHNVYSGLILEDGSTVAANTGSGHLIYFDSAGTAYRIVGGRGRGPGEFVGQMRLVAETGAGIAVLDPGVRQLSLFSEGGDFRGSFTIQAPPSRTVVGYLLGLGTVSVANQGEVGEPRAYEIWSDDGSVGVELTGPPEPVRNSISWMAPVPPVGMVVQQSIRMPAECAAIAAEVTVGGAIYAMDAANGVVTTHSSDGGVQNVLVAQDRMQVTRQMGDWLRSELGNAPTLATLPPDTIESAIRRHLSVGALLPAWSGMIADPSGRLWLSVQKCGPTEEMRTYQIVTSEGERVAAVAVPTAWRLLAVRGDRVLVIRRSELGVEHLEMYSLLSTELGPR